MKKFLFVIIALLLVSNCFALDLDSEPEECENVEFYSPSTWISCGLAKMYQNAVDFLIMPLEQVTEAFWELMTIDIDIATLGPYWAKVNYIVSAFIVLMIVYVGYLWLFAAVDTEKRRIAKEQTLHYFILMASKFLGHTVSILFCLCIEEAKSKHLEFSP